MESGQQPKRESGEPAYRDERKACKHALLHESLQLTAPGGGLGGGHEGVCSWSPAKLVNQLHNRPNGSLSSTV